MIRRLFRFVWSIVVLSAVVWFVFFVELGERTLFQHLARIAQTEEAQDLGREVRQAGERVGDEARRAIAEGEHRPDAAVSTDAPPSAGNNNQHQAASNPSPGDAPTSNAAP